MKNIKRLSDQLKYKSVLWYSDNWNVARILDVGSPKDHLQELSLEIFAISIKHANKIITFRIPTGENELVDAISKFKDTDEWGIDGKTLNFIQKKFAPLDIDCFADPNNTKLAHFDA